MYFFTISENLSDCQLNARFAQMGYEDFVFACGKSRNFGWVYIVYFPGGSIQVSWIQNDWPLNTSMVPIQSLCFPNESSMTLIRTWNPKQPFINGCFNWMIPNLYIGNGCFTKHLFINGCLGFQELLDHTTWTTRCRFVSRQIGVFSACNQEAST